MKMCVLYEQQIYLSIQTKWSLLVITEYLCIYLDI